MGVTAVDQLTGGGRFAHEDCGEACVVSIKRDAGKLDTVSLEEAFDQLHGDNPADGTGGQVHAGSLVAAGLRVHVDVRPTRDVLANLRAHGLNRCMIAIWSNHAGDPAPGSGIGHWILWTGGSTYMQPVGGRLVSYDDGLVEQASQNYHVIVDEPIGVAAPAVGGDEMQYMDAGPAKSNADLIARRVKCHEWKHASTATPQIPSGQGIDGPTMDKALALWVQSGGEAVYAMFFGA